MSERYGTGCLICRLTETPSGLKGVRYRLPHLFIPVNYQYDC